MIKKFLSPKAALWALDFGEKSVVALAAHEKAPGQWQLLGAGQAEPAGRERGEIVKVGDAVEAVVQAVRGAERGAGLRCRSLFFNFDDAGIVSEHPTGLKTLSGEGQIAREDVRDAAHSASRAIGDFERAPVYTREVNYLIDGKDSVADPIGVFGHRLDVTLHVILARARHLEKWKTVMRRVPLEQFFPVLSLDSVCQAVLDRRSGPRIVWDLGEDFTAGGVYEQGALREYRVFWTDAQAAGHVETASRAWSARYENSGTPVVTGERAGHVHLKTEHEIAQPKQLPEFSEPRHASAVGLLVAASQRKRRIAYTKAGGIWAARAKEKASAFMQEYF